MSSMFPFPRGILSPFRTDAMLLTNDQIFNDSWIFSPSYLIRMARVLVFFLLDFLEILLLSKFLPRYVLKNCNVAFHATT